MITEPLPPPSGRRTRLTRRGRFVLIAAAVLAVAMVVALVSLLFGGSEKEKKPTATLLIPEGWRASQIYAAVDKALGKTPGTTREAAATAGLKLPAASEGNPEGYLFPATYPVDATTTPSGLLSFMVNTADEKFGAERVTSGAQRGGMTVYQTVNIASIVQAEADTPEDMGKVARVVYNRLARNMPLQMDSTLNYALNRSTLDTTTEDTRIDSPYNSYEHRGLPPTPIGNPGEQALHAAISPPAGDWLYFVTVGPGDTRFTADYQDHQRNVADFNSRRRGDG
ncbi:endolytic transglycosylase MltG [Streptomyces sp. NPDC004838]